MVVVDVVFAEDSDLSLAFCCRNWSVYENITTKLCESLIRRTSNFYNKTYYPSTSDISFY